MICKFSFLLLCGWRASTGAREKVSPATKDLPGTYTILKQNRINRKRKSLNSRRQFRQFFWTEQWNKWFMTSFKSEIVTPLNSQKTAHKPTFQPKLPFQFEHSVFLCRWASVKQTQGRKDGGKEGTIPRATNHYGGAKSLRGAPKSPNIVTSTFLTIVNALTKDLIRTWGRQTCFLRREPSNFVKPLSKRIRFPLA